MEPLFKLKFYNNFTNKVIIQEYFRDFSEWKDGCFIS